jgi:hypothetical protein
MMLEQAVLELNHVHSSDNDHEPETVLLAEHGQRVNAAI